MPERIEGQRSPKRTPRLSESKKRTSATSSYTDLSLHGEQIQPSEESQLLDTLITGFRIKNDAQLALWLGIDKSLIYAIRAGKRRLGIMQRLKILDHIHFLKARSIVEAILPARLASELVAFNNTTVHHNIAKKQNVDEAANVNLQLLNETKVAFGLETDAELAAFLQLEYNTVATVRAGKSALGPKPRLRILERIFGDFDADELLLAIDSSKNLQNIICDWLSSQQATPYSL